MQFRTLGRSDIEVAPLAFGGNVFGWTADEATSFALLDAFVDAGFNLVDTADVYSRWAHNGEGGQSETIIGKWFAKSGKRDRVVLATKAGMEMGPGRKGLSKEYIRQAIDASLERLQTDYIDLYQAHADDESVTQGETLEAFTDLVRAGKVRIIGASNFSATRLRSALDVSASLGLARYETLQPEYNLYDREAFERGLQQACVDERVGVISYFSLASGFLTGKYRSDADIAARARKGMLQKYFNPRGMRILDALDRIASDLNATPAQVALAWIMAKPAIVAPIASATSLDQLKDLVAAASLRLDAAAMRTLNEASAPQPTAV
jgi:aryl-alcohol dehydrogenase-like predicted oxidoreductase